MDTARRSAVDPSAVSSAAEVAERVAHGQVNLVPAAPTRTVGADRPRERLHPVQRAARRDARADPCRRADAGRAVRLRARRERPDRDRAGAARQADARPAHAAHGAQGARSCATATARRSRRRRSCVDDVLELAPGDQVVVDGEVLAATGSRSTSRCSPASRSPSSRRRATACCRARSSRRARAASRSTDVGAEAYAVHARAGGPPVHARRARSSAAGIDRILRYVTWAIVPTAALLFVSQFRVRTTTGARRSRGVGRRHGRDGARGARAADERSRSRSRSCGWPRDACSCRSCPPSRGSRASTCCASTRPARSPRAGSRSSASSVLDDDLDPVPRRSRRSRPPTRTQRDAARRSATRSPTAPTAGRGRTRCRSRPRGSGAPPRSTGTARGSSARRTC